MNRPTGATENRLLARLLTEDGQHLVQRCERVALEFKSTIYEALAPIDYVYFPLTGVTSFLTIMEDGSAIEVASVGKEGAVGATALLGAAISPHRVIVQAAGESLRIPLKALIEEAASDTPLFKLLLRYQNAFLATVSQSVACNGLHHVQQRCCRWLLMTHDRLESNELPLTHEFLAMMLGVRRSSVTEVLQSLKARNLLTYTRGSVTILARKGLERECCECYRAVKDGYERIFS